MNCENCPNKDECDIVVRVCPKCHKQAAEYRFNKAGNLAFCVCICCGYSAEDYARDLEE